MPSWIAWVQRPSGLIKMRKEVQDKRFKLMEEELL